MCIIGTPGNFSQTEKSKMFLSWKTYEGLQITVHSIIEAIKYSIIEAIKYLLGIVMSSVLIRNVIRFNQDVLEEYLAGIEVLDADMIIQIYITLAIIQILFICNVQ